MRIISPFQDFYDKQDYMYVDPTCIYNRKSSEHILPLIPGRKELFPLPLTLRHGRHYISYNILGICGNFYSIAQLDLEDYTTLFCWNKRDFEIALNNNNISLSQWFYFKQELNNFWDYTNQKSDNLFIEYNAPLILINRGYYISQNKETVITVNPKLQSLNAHRVLNRFEVFQTIHTYLTNVLVRRDNPDEIADKYKIEQHGFDKHSFRNPTKLKDLK